MGRIWRHSSFDPSRVGASAGAFGRWRLGVQGARTFRHPGLPACQQSRHPSRGGPDSCSGGLKHAPPSRIPSTLPAIGPRPRHVGLPLTRVTRRPAAVDMPDRARRVGDRRLKSPDSKLILALPGPGTRTQGGHVAEAKHSLIRQVALLAARRASVRHPNHCTGTKPQAWSPDTDLVLMSLPEHACRAPPRAPRTSPHRQLERATQPQKSILARG